MDDDYPYERKSRPWLWALSLSSLAFIGGMTAMGYAVTHDARTAKLLHLEPTDQAQADIERARDAVARTVPVPTNALKAGSLPVSDSQISSRVSALEDRVDDIETRAKEATGDASRAEGLLVAFAARRALDRGIELGYIEGLLRQRFGATQPQAVAVILSAARQPVTLADLQTELDAISATLSSGGMPQQSWWQSVRQELAGLVVVRRVGEPSNLPADRVGRAGRMLEAGQVDQAMAEVIRVPDHRSADKWIAAARRYVAGRLALDQIETAALLNPDAPSPARNVALGETLGAAPPLVSAGMSQPTPATNAFH